ncbi:MAG: hypothetical protein ACK4Z9_00950 [Thermodesulfovibrionales bacterium]
MKDAAFTDLICKGFCSFYKEGKEEFTCGAYNFLVRNLTEKELSNQSVNMEKTPDLSFDDYIKSTVCSRCEFLKEDCDFRAGKHSPPCGGYVVIEKLMRTYQV